MCYQGIYIWRGIQQLLKLLESQHRIKHLFTVIDIIISFLVSFHSPCEELQIVKCLQNKNNTAERKKYRRFQEREEDIFLTQLIKRADQGKYSATLFFTNRETEKDCQMGEHTSLEVKPSLLQHEINLVLTRGPLPITTEKP